MNGLQILLSDAIAAGLYTEDTGADLETDGFLVSESHINLKAVLYKNSEIERPLLSSEVESGSFPESPTGAFLTLRYDHSFSWETRVDGGEF